MKKMVVWSGVIISGVALVVGAYFGMGLLTERTLEHTISMLDQSNGVWVELTNYQRGLFRSRALLTWKLRVPAHSMLNKDGQHVNVPEAMYQMPMPLLIQHGPLGISQDHVYLGLGYAQTSMELPTEVNDVFDKNYTTGSIKPKINVSFSVNYLNSTHVSVVVPRFKVISKKDNHKFEWLGMTSETQIANQGKRVRGTFALSGVEWQQNQVSLLIGPVESNYDLHPSASGLYMGDARVVFSSLRMTEQGKTLINMDNMRLDSSSNVLNMLFQSQAKLAVEQILFQDHKYGPMNVDASIKNLDSDVLAKINQQLTDSSPDSKMNGQRILFTVLPEIPALVNKGAIFAVHELNLKLPEGDVHGSMHLVFPKENISNPIHLSQKISGGLKLTIGSQVLKKWMTLWINHPWGSKKVEATTDNPEALADSRIASMFQAGVLAKDGQDDSIELKLSNGHVLVNGHPFTASMLSL